MSAITEKKDKNGKPYFVDANGKRVAAPKNSISSTKTPNTQMLVSTEETRALPGTAGTIAKGYKNYQAIQGPGLGGSYRGSMAVVVGSNLHWVAIFNDGGANGSFAVFIPKSKLGNAPYYIPADYAEMFVETADASITLGDDYGVLGKKISAITSSDLATPINDCIALGVGNTILNTSAAKFYRSTRVVNGFYQKPFGYSPAGAAQTTAITEALSVDTPTNDNPTGTPTTPTTQTAGQKLLNWVKKNVVTIVIVVIVIGGVIYFVSKRK